MADLILAALVERLQATRPKVAWIHVFGTLGAYFATVQTKELGWRAARLAPHSRRAAVHSWLWPCHRMDAIQRALEEPTEEGCGAIVELFRSVALIRHLQANRQVRNEVGRFYEIEFPFNLVVLAHLAGRPRSLTPKPATRQVKAISDVEARLAWNLWKVAETAHTQLLAAFEGNGIARTCPHCDLLTVDLGRKYCSEACRIAFLNAKNYLNRKIARKHD